MTSRETVLPRSPELMSRSDTALLVVDVQDKLVRLIEGHEPLIWNIRRLLDGTKILGMPAWGTEQYPQGLGPTTAELASRLGKNLSDKLTFSCGGCAEFLAALRESGVSRILVAGIEAHVCVQQTVLDMMADGYRVYVAADAIGSRSALDRDMALRRMEIGGATITTTEAALFEWCEAAGTPEFKAISALVRETPPGAPVAR